MSKFVGVIIGLILFSIGGKVAAQIVDIPFADGEELVYSISYKARFFPNTEAGHVTITTTKVELDEKTTYKVVGSGRVSESFQWFYNLDDVYTTWLDSVSLRPQKMEFSLLEGTYRARGWFLYDWENMSVKSHFHNLKREPYPEREQKLVGNSMDALAMFYSLRATNLSKFIVGEENNVKLVLEDTLRTVTFKFLGKERINMSNLGRFNTLKFSCTLASSSESGFKDGAVFYLWISDDKNKIPIYLETPIRVGSVRVSLLRADNLKYGIDSFIE